MKHTLSRALLVGVVLALSASRVSLSQPTSQAAENIVFILDASGSMWGQIDGQNKIVIARSVLGDLLGSLPDKTDIGLVAYGHRREGDCSDIETIAGLGEMARGELIDRVNAINPKGKTPITQSVNQTLGALKGRDGAVTVILVSDGLETCDGDPCLAVTEARESGIDFVMHVVGFGLQGEDVSQLACMAQAGGGSYHDAASADDLALALDEVVEYKADSTEAVIRVSATALGEPVDAGVFVTDAATGEDVTFGRTYEGPATNPLHLGVMAGTYNLLVKAISMKGDVERTFSAINIAPGDTVSRSVDFSPGELAVRVLRNGELSDATVSVHRAGTKDWVVGGRTYVSESSNPRTVSLTAGAYDVTIGSVEIAGTVEHQWESVTVEPGGRTELEHAFQSGILRIGSSRGEELLDAIVIVRDPESNRSVDQNRTYTSESSNPTHFVLEPGTYSVGIKPLGRDAPSERTITVTVREGETEEQTIDFSQ